MFPEHKVLACSQEQTVSWGIFHVLIDFVCACNTFHVLGTLRHVLGTPPMFLGTNHVPGTLLCLLVTLREKAEKARAAAVEEVLLEKSEQAKAVAVEE
jgi:hypothetical protein